ncbi:MAG: stage II sporulation protein D [Oscillospiraceae bacterium]|nr:stage II sporulation protein D [Oscillospiraceae bacterium]
MIYSFTLGMVVPGLVFSAGDKLVQKEPTVEQVLQEQVYIPVLMSDGKLRAMELEQYISRVVLGEMPASFDREALKAQAVAARTYTLRCLADGDRHQGAVCTDYRCCQSYLEPEDYVGNRGTQTDMEKVFDAVTQTAGEVVCYDGDLIYATYFASAGGQTEAAQEVWGQGYPYLVPVSSPEQSVYDGERIGYSLEEFQECLGVTLRGGPETWFGAATYTVGGGVDSMRIGDYRYSGVELRNIFGLRSTIFNIAVTENSIVFETMGYGHRVGLSQYGANAMANAGSSYNEILTHYYQGTTLQKYSSD